MQPAQRWLFPTGPERHIHPETLRKIFAHYVLKSGLDPAYSWHSLRHGRGVVVFERFEDSVMVRDMLRQKSLSSAEMYMHLSPKRAEALRLQLESEKVATNPFIRKTL